MPLTPEEWELLKPVFTERTTWLLIGGQRDAYAALFVGTLEEAAAEALRHATYWKTTTTIYHAPGGRAGGDKVAMARISPVSKSPLKG